MKHNLNQIVPQAEAQNDAILNYMMDGNRINHRKAQRLFNCDRLAARIFDLRQYGYHIIAHKVTKNGKTFASYELEDTGRVS